MIYLWISLLALVHAGCLMLNLVALPGNWLMLGVTFLFAWWRMSEGIFSIWTLVAVVALAVLGEALELLTGMAGARAAGSTKRGALGALLGGILGSVAGTILIPIPLLGSLAGASLDAFVGAFTAETSNGRPHSASVRIGVKAGIGTVTGMILKLTIGIVIWLIITIAALVP
jgi:uncharacterized protein YqgC (DUF456 family)